MPLKENYYYHIYNRGINSNAIFRSAKDYKKFLEKFFFYCFLSLDTYAYCLLNNHFHFLVRVRSEQEQKHLFDLHRKKDKKRFYGLMYQKVKIQKASTQLGHLFNSYTRSFNTHNNTTGPLLEGRFKRIEAGDALYRARLICYIHRNPIHHHLVKDYRDYPWSSFNSFSSGDNRLLNHDEAYSWFGGTEGFFRAHEEMKLKLDQDMLLE